MRLSLAHRRNGGQLRDRLGGRTSPAETAAPERDHVVAASETVTLVLGENSPLPENSADVEDLVRRLRGYVAQLGARTAATIPALLRVQQLCSESIPEGYMPSRVYLVRLAEATRELGAYVEHSGLDPITMVGRRRRPRSTVNVLCGTVFTITLLCLVFAASGLRT